MLEEKPTVEAPKPKSEGAIVVLGTFMAPWLGTLYTNPGNPYAIQNTPLRFALRLLSDVAGVGVMFEPMLFPHSRVLEMCFIALGIFDLAFSRVMSLLDDLTMPAVSGRARQSRLRDARHVARAAHHRSLSW